MINRLMLSVAAAALIAGTGLANAQGNTNREAPSAGSATQQSAPAATPESGAPAAKSAQSEEKMQPKGAKTQRAQSDMKAGPQGEKSAEENNMRGEKSKSMSSENEKGSASKDMKAEGRDNRINAESKGRDNRMNAESKGMDSKGASETKSSASETKSQTTVGQAGAGAKLSSEQRTKITTVIKSQHVAPVEHVNFSISVGTRIPHDVRFYPLPAEVVTIYPEWRGYEFILVGDQIVVIDPRSFEIVAVIEA